MELRQLTYFLAIMEHSNMSKASQELHVSQPALSASLKDLERELGVPLFDRAGRRLSLNDNGRYFAERARSALAILTDAQTALGGGVSEREQAVHCLTNMPLGRVGKALFRSFHDEHPSVAVRIGFKESSFFESERSAIDLEIFGLHEDLEPNERLVKLGYERYVMALPLNHPLANQPSIKLRDMKNDGFLIGEASPMVTVMEGMFQEAGFTPRIVGELQLYSDILQMVRANMGCAIAAEVTWFEDEEKELAIRPIEDIKRGRFLYARVPKDRDPSAATWVLLDHLRHITENGFPFQSEE